MNYFYAVKNSGAFLNGHQIYVSTTNNLSNSLVATGFPYYDFEYIESYTNTLKYLMTHTRGIRRLGSNTIDLCFTACGRFDLFFEYSLSPWDVAAGALILQEAEVEWLLILKEQITGCTVSKIIGSNQNLSEETLLLLKKYF